MSEILVYVSANVNGEDVFVGEYKDVTGLEEELYKIEAAIARAEEEENE